jgi:hypothetical protein
VKCPSCDCGEVATTWIHHKFPYGEDHVMLKAWVPLRTCLCCSEEWLDHVAEGIMEGIVIQYQKGLR